MGRMGGLGRQVFGGKQGTAISMAPGPLSRITPMAPMPGGVLRATMVSSHPPAFVVIFLPV